MTFSLTTSHASRHISRMLILAVLCWLVTINGSCAYAETISRFERGITGVRTFQYDGPPLRAKTQRDTATTLVVRLQRGQNAGQYEVRFIGNVPGQYDLRDWIEQVSGAPANALSPLSIEIVSTLPHDQRSDLFETDSFQPQIAGGYRLALALTVLAWLAIPAALVLRKMMTPKPPELVAQESATVPVIDQLRTLVGAASRGELSTSDKARLELLLLHYWRETERLPQLDMASSIQQLRKHEQAGPMITAVEAWLHREPTNTEASSLEHVLQILKSIRSEDATVGSPMASAVAGSDAS